MKFYPVVPEIFREQVHVPRKERKEEENNNNNNNKKRSKTIRVDFVIMFYKNVVLYEIYSKILQ